MASGRHFRLVSFDGGGPRCLSQLMMMKLIMHGLCEWHPDNAVKKMVPFEHFDLMGGSDTGGIIVIMFVRMKMSVEEAIKAFCYIIKRVYAKGLSPRERTEILRECMEDLLKERGLPVDLKLEEKNPNGGCLGFVMAASALSISNKVCFRTYRVINEMSSGITVVDAALATCALPSEFLPVSISDAPESFPYAGAGVGANNPVRKVISEASRHFKADPGVLLSLGSGHPGILALDLDSGDLRLNSLMHQMMVDCEREDLEVRQQMNHPEYYFRFSVEQGLQKNDGRADNTKWIAAQTMSYMEDPKTNPRVLELVQKIMIVGIGEGALVPQTLVPGPAKLRPWLMQEAFISYETLRPQNNQGIIEPLEVNLRHSHSLCPPSNLSAFH